MNRFDYLTAHRGWSQRQCGECTLCCKLMAVGELQKTVNVWCKHCRRDGVGGGCGIYDERPNACREFACIWLQRDAVPERFKPSKSRVVMVPNGDGSGVTVMVDPGMPHAWKDPDLLEYLQGVSQHMTIVVDTGKRAYQIVPFGYRELEPHQIRRSVASNGYLVTEPMGV